MNYSSNPQKFVEIAKPYLGEPFVRCLTDAIKTERKLNYSDRLPRYVLEDVSIDINTSTLTFVFSGNVVEKIQYLDNKIDQSHSVPTEFYITNKETRDYYVIIFNC